MTVEHFSAQQILDFVSRVYEVAGRHGLYATAHFPALHRFHSPPGRDWAAEGLIECGAFGSEPLRSDENFATYEKTPLALASRPALVALYNSLISLERGADE
jgi:hypothetical protein